MMYRLPSGRKGEILQIEDCGREGKRKRLFGTNRSRVWGVQLEIWGGVFFDKSKGYLAEKGEKGSKGNGVVTMEGAEEGVEAFIGEVGLKNGDPSWNDIDRFGPKILNCKVRDGSEYSVRVGRRTLGKTIETKATGTPRKPEGGRSKSSKRTVSRPPFMDRRGDWREGGASGFGISRGADTIVE